MKTEVKNFAKKIACMLAMVVTVALPATAFSEFETVQPGHEDSVVSSGQVERNTLEAGFSHFIALLDDGHVISMVEDNSKAYGQYNVSDWDDIISVAAGFFFSVGLKSDGTVVGTGAESGFSGSENWTDIVDIACGAGHSVGLKSNGTVVAVGDNDSGQINVSDWTDIVNISAGSWHTIGLKKDGTVVATGSNSYGQCDVGNWRDIVDIAGNNWVTVGLRSDGTMVYAGGWGDASDKRVLEELKRWRNIVSVKAYDSTTIFGIRSDGVLLSLGDGEKPDVIDAAYIRGDGTCMYLRPDCTIECNKSKFEKEVNEKLQGKKIQPPTVYERMDNEEAETTQDTGIWVVKAYVDEFNLPTDEKYIVNSVPFNGTFRNSATSNSELNAYLFYTRAQNYDILSVELWEYGRYHVNNPFSQSRKYNVTVMDKDGYKSSVEGVMYSDSYDLYFLDEQPVLDALKKGGTVRFSITEKENSLTKYVITIEDAAGFSSVYNSFWSK